MDVNKYGRPHLSECLRSGGLGNDVLPETPCTCFDDSPEWTI